MNQQNPSTMEYEKPVLIELDRNLLLNGAGAGSCGDYGSDTLPIDCEDGSLEEI